MLGTGEMNTFSRTNFKKSMDMAQSVQILSYNWKQWLAHATMFDSNYQFETKIFGHNIY